MTDLGLQGKVAEFVKLGAIGRLCTMLTVPDLPTAARVVDTLDKLIVAGQSQPPDPGGKNAHAAAVFGVGGTATSTSFRTVFRPFISSTPPCTRGEPCFVVGVFFYLVHRLTTCRSVLAIRCSAQFGASGTVAALERLRAHDDDAVRRKAAGLLAFNS